MTTYKRWLWSLVLYLLTWVLISTICNAGIAWITNVVEYEIPTLLHNKSRASTEFNGPFVWLFVWLLAPTFMQYGSVGAYAWFVLLFDAVHLLSLECLWRNNKSQVVRFSVIVGCLIGVSSLLLIPFISNPTPWRQLGTWQVIVEYASGAFVASVGCGYIIGVFWRYYPISMLAKREHKTE